MVTWISEIVNRIDAKSFNANVPNNIPIPTPITIQVLPNEVVAVVIAIITMKATVAIRVGRGGISCRPLRIDYHPNHPPAVE